MACSGGSDWRTIYVGSIDPVTGVMTTLKDKLVNVKFSSTQWTADKKVCLVPPLVDTLHAR